MHFQVKQVSMAVNWQRLNLILLAYEKLNTEKSQQCVCRHTLHYDVTRSFNGAVGEMRCTAVERGAPGDLTVTPTVSSQSRWILGQRQRATYLDSTHKLKS